MSDNTTAGPFRDRRDQRDQRDDVTRTPGTPGTSGASGTPGTPEAGGVRGGGSDTVSQGVVGHGAGTRGRDTAAQERAREGRDTVVDGERIPAAAGPSSTTEHDRSPGRENATGRTTGSRSGASREGVLGAEARVTAGTGAGTSGRLMHDEGDKLSLRLQHAVTAFVDGPRGSVEEADQVLQEVAERFADAVTQRRRTLRSSWQTSGEGKADTEQLRLALKDYRELAERLLKL
ncbi:hypothetical protein [Streptomyces sp. NPDC006285]|uniref:hypothetical protein n=1 Tax=Streptomyces sp. NPDC006285 TaxID=3364742 RepID=UPI00368046AB